MATTYYYFLLLVMWWRWSKFAFVECKFWLSKFLKCECE